MSSTSPSPSSSPQPASSLTAAERVYLDFAAQRDATAARVASSSSSAAGAASDAAAAGERTGGSSSGSASFDALCAAHPALAEDLRRLRQLDGAVQEFLRQAAQGQRVAAALSEHYGEGVDPGISLDGGRPASDSAPSSELLRRLRTHAPKDSRYQLLGEIGRGGMGAVIRVWDEDLRRTLAMKVVLGKEDKAAKGATPPVDSKTLGRFLEEAQITGQLDHPGIVPVHELGLGADGQVYFTMRLVKGEDLRTIFRHVETGHEGWSTTRALGVMLKVCEAMAYAHAKGVIHRDLKPANIMVGKYGEVYVMDWGLARVAGAKDLHDVRLKEQPPAPTSQSVRTERREERDDTPDSPLVTMDGDVMGTPAYMPPEQARGELAQLGAHSDVYAVGAMIYHLLLVKHIEMPYVPKGAKVSQHRVLMSVLEEAPKEIATYDKTVPAPLAALVEKAMQRDIARRYRDMEELAADLRAYIEGRVVKAYETGTWAETKQWVKRNKPLTAAAAAAVLALAGGVVVSMAQARAAEEQRSVAEEQRVLASSNARLAAQRASEAEAERERTASANAALERTNADLDAQKQRAEASEAKAKASAEESEQKANDVLSLSAQKDYEDLVAAAEKLWPADSEMVPRYEEWLAKARELVGGRPADDAKGLKKRPSLVEHKAKLAELRREALPLSEEQIRVDRETHPQFADWQTKSADLLWRSRMLAIEAWPDRAAVEAELAAESAAKQLPGDPDGLNALARKLVDPKQPILGQEVRALVLAEYALKAADKQTSADTTPAAGAAQAGRTVDTPEGADGKPSAAATRSRTSRAGIRDTYAWALYRNGKLDEALGEMKTALTEPGGDELKQSAKDLEKAVQQWQGEEVAKRRERREALSKEVDALAAAVNERRTFEYTDAEKTWWDRQLRVLVQNLENFQNPDSGLMGSGVNPAFGWGVQKRYEFAKSVRELTVDSAEAKRRWDEAILAIAKSEKYRDTLFPGGGLLTPQEGLLPLGPDPQSGLWEFWHVQSGDEPERDKDGNFVRQKSGAHKLVEKSGASANAAASRAGGETSMLGAAGANGARGTGIVLVLIPGGTFWMGAQKTDPNGQNYDPDARGDESVHRVTLSPYFLSKYELTQGQWSRFTGLNPSYYKSGFNGTVGITNPVETVDWMTCERVTRGLGLELPSEAQWEFGARGGTSSVWWTGSAKESLADKVNLADQSYVEAGGAAGQAAWWPEFKDGFGVHAPVGRLAANDFGLHEVCGNVWEWCFDAYEDYPEAGDASSATRDPRVDGDGLATRVDRGGSFNNAATGARSAIRSGNAPSDRYDDLGVRPSRAITP